METEQTEDGTIELWSPQEVKAAMEQGEIVLVDVRTPQEFSFERIHGALLAPMHSFDAAHMPGESDKRIVFHCGSGARSGKVARNYLASGHSRTAHMKGGFGAWKEAGFDYTTTDMSNGAPKTTAKSSG